MRRSNLLILILIAIFLEVKCKSNESLRKLSGSYTRMTALFDKSNRAQQLYLRQVFQDLEIHRNSQVADIGAGTGWLTVRLGAFVGPKGKIYAVEILPRYVSYIEEKVKEYKLNNVEPILGSATDPKLSESTLDAVIILIAYHEFKQPITMLTKIHRAMKAGARLGIIERDTDQMRAEAREAYTKKGYILHRVNETLPDSFLTNEHSLALNIVVREARTVGFEFLFSRELGDDYYIAIFVKS